MATSIEYGLIAALVSVAAVTAMNTLSKEKPQSVTRSPLTVVEDVKKTEYGNIVKDKETGCQYILVHEGLSIRHLSDGRVTCPRSSLNVNRN